MPGQAVVHTDAVMLERLIGNLVANAIRYADEGAVMLACRRARGAVRIQVRDSGRGIAPEEHDRIFEEYYQIGNPERDRAKGLGLGLATVRRMAAALGARVSVRSFPGKGSTFEVSVPAGDPSKVAPAAAAAQAPEHGSLRGARVLVIDDEAPIREGMCALLRQWGCESVAVAGAREAQAALAGRPPAVIVADLRLGEGASGIDAIAHVRGLAASEVPAILVTGDASPDRAQRAAPGALAVLLKPVQPAQLHAALAQAIAANY